MDNSKYRGTIVKMEHFREREFCARGVRYGFIRYNLDYNDFLFNGIDGEKLLNVTNNDAMVTEAVEVAYGRQF
jgi:hypothetical protein